MTSYGGRLLALAQRFIDDEREHERVTAAKV
jgi:hypothetical protein